MSDKLISAANKYLFCVRKDLVGYNNENESEAINKLYEKERSELVKKLSVGISRRESLMQKSRDDFAKEIKSSMQKNISEYYDNLNEYVKHCNEKNGDSDTMESEGRNSPSPVTGGNTTAQNEEVLEGKDKKSELSPKCDKRKISQSDENSPSKKRRFENSSSNLTISDLQRIWTSDSEDSCDKDTRMAIQDAEQEDA